MAYIGEDFTGKPNRIIPGTDDDYGNTWLQENNPNTVSQVIGGYYTALDAPSSASYLNIWTGGPRPSEMRGVFRFPFDVGTPTGTRKAGLHLWGVQPGTGAQIPFHCQIGQTRLLIDGTSGFPTPLTKFQTGSVPTYLGGQQLAYDTDYLIVALFSGTQATINLSRVSDGVKFLTNHVAADTRWLGTANKDTPGAYPVWETIRATTGDNRAKWKSARATIGNPPPPPPPPPGGTPQPTNQPPTVNAGTDLTSTVGASVSRTAVASDPGGGALTYQWSTTASAPVTFIGSTTTAAVTFRADGPGVFTVSCTVTDTGGLTAKDSLRLTATTTAGPVPSNTAGQIPIR